MARYRHAFLLPIDEAQATWIVQSFLQQNGFALYAKNGETCFKKGSGWVSAPQFLNVTIVNGVAQVEAWIKMAILPGVYVGEMDFNGFWGFAIKNALKSKVQMLERSLGFLPGVTPEYAPVNTAPPVVSSPMPVPPTVPTPLPTAPAASVTPAVSAESSAAGVARFCLACGTPLAPGGQFCGRCGTPVFRPASTAEAAAEPAGADEPRRF